jgi:predicted DNA-binding transcriptional regulator YafY
MSRSDADFLTAKILGLASRPDREALADKQDEDKKSQTDSSVMKNVEIISQAIEQKRKIQFVPMQYVAQRATHTARYNFTHTVSPRNLTWKQGRCMLEATMHNSYGANINMNYDVAFMDDIKILSVRSVVSKPDRTEMPTMEETLDIAYGKERAITIRFNREVLDEVVRELGEDAMLIPVDDSHFKVTIKERISKFYTNRDFLSWVSSFGCAAKILAPQDVVDYYVNWCKKESEHIQDLYEQNKENQSDILDIFVSKLAQADDERFIRLVFDI